MDVRKDFPQLDIQVNGYPLAYLDNCATTLKPTIVLSAIFDYYSSYCSNIYRGSYFLSAESTEACEYSRKLIADYFGCSKDEIIFTRNTTEGINLIALCLKPNLVVSSIMDHHSAILPFRERVKLVRINKNGDLDYDDLRKKSKGADLISITHISNVLGTINDVKEIKEIAEENGCLFLLDCAQSGGHQKLDLHKMDVEFASFSSHKMLGPTGLGFLYIRRDILESLKSPYSGGETIEHVFLGSKSLKIEWKLPPERWEAGTPHIAGIIGLGASVHYLDQHIHWIPEHEKRLTSLFIEGLERLNISYLGKPKRRSGIVSFYLKGRNPHEVALALDRVGICVRSGHHCAEPLHQFYGISGTVRASFYLYNNEEEVIRALDALERIKKGASPDDLGPLIGISNPLKDLIEGRRPPAFYIEREEQENIDIPTSYRDMRQVFYMAGDLCPLCPHYKVCGTILEEGNPYFWVFCPLLRKAPLLKSAFIRR